MKLKIANVVVNLGLNLIVISISLVLLINSISHLLINSTAIDKEDMEALVFFKEYGIMLIFGVLQSYGILFIVKAVVYKKYCAQMIDEDYSGYIDKIKKDLKMNIIYMIGFSLLYVLLLFGVQSLFKLEKYPIEGLPVGLIFVFYYGFVTITKYYTLKKHDEI